MIVSDTKRTRANPLHLLAESVNVLEVGSN
jgi:hypothetical protein